MVNSAKLGSYLVRSRSCSFSLKTNKRARSERKKSKIKTDGRIEISEVGRMSSDVGHKVDE